MADHTEQPARTQQVEQYVPGEVCLVVETTAPLSDGDKDLQEKAVYDGVQQHLNGKIAGLLERIALPTLGDFPQDDLRDDMGLNDLRDDMGLNVLQRRLEKEDALLLAQDLPPHNSEASRSPDPAMPRPWVRFGGAKDSLPTLLCFYPIARSGDGPDEDRIADDIAIVRGVVNVVNLERVRDEKSTALADANWKIAAATPNWLMAGAPADVPTGGPGSRPEPVPAPPASATVGRRPWTVQFDYDGVPSELKKAMAEGKGDDIVVAVLDTCPPKQRVSDAAICYPNNWLLKKVDDDVHIDEPPSIPAAYFEAWGTRPELNYITVNWRKERHSHGNSIGHGIPISEADREKFDISDHGLFAAGLIKDVAPNADIHLIRVLGDAGVGDMWALIDVLARLPEKYLESDTKRLIINMSLMCDLPPGVSMPAGTNRQSQPPSKRFLKYWFPRTFDQLSKRMSEREVQEFFERVADTKIKAAIPLLHHALYRVVQRLEEYDGRILAVAAAGNDALVDEDTEGLPATRLPARYDHVLGVAALDREFRPARYTNRGDELVMGDGVATYGGNVLPEALPTPEPAGPHLIDAYEPGPTGPQPQALGEVDAVVGIFSAKKVPQMLGAAFDGDRTNRTGWAYWSGTSFATPIITGVAARLWSSPAGMAWGWGPNEVIGQVRRFGGGTNNPDVGCPILKAFQRPNS